MILPVQTIILQLYSWLTNRMAASLRSKLFSITLFMNTKCFWPKYRWWNIFCHNNKIFHLWSCYSLSHKHHNLLYHPNFCNNSCPGSSKSENISDPWLNTMFSVTPNHSISNVVQKEKITMVQPLLKNRVLSYFD